MRKEEFLEGLQRSLSGQVAPTVIQENVRFYEDYIQGELKKGRDESEVMEELGEPRLIAHSIVDATPGAGEGVYDDYDPTDPRSANQERSKGQSNSQLHYYDLSKWYWKLIGIAILVIVVVVIITIVGGVLSLVIPMLPVIGLICLVMWFVRGGSKH